MEIIGGVEKYMSLIQVVITIHYVLLKLHIRQDHWVMNSRRYYGTITRMVSWDITRSYESWPMSMELRLGMFCFAL